ncbi:hypothetical protein K2X85_08345 [bacterium]|nr:hypothetical protein [bacterium]
MKLLATVVLSLILFPVSVTLAHDPSMHRGPKIDGTVRSVDSKSMTVETVQGTVVILLSPETKYQRSNGEVQRNSDIKSREHVTVMGHKLADGAFAAREVLVHDAEKGSVNTSPKDAFDSEGYDSSIR